MIEQSRTGTRLTGFYRGKVLEHGPGGKCKIFWPGANPSEWENKPENLPYAEQAAPLFASDGTNGEGVFFYPKIGTTVWGFFENEDVNYPVYFAASIDYSKTSQTYESLKETLMTDIRKSKVVKTEEATIVLDGSKLGMLGSCLAITTKKGDSIVFKANGGIEVSSPTSIKLESPEIHIKQTGEGTSIDIDSENVVVNGGMAASVYSKEIHLNATGGSIKLVADDPSQMVIVE